MSSKAIMQTYSGGPFDLLNPRPEDIRILDIAEALSKINRFAGHTKYPYSVAQHSILVSMFLDESGLEMDGLFHDAHEAYVNDITSPMKVALKHVAGADLFARVEAPIRRAIARQFGLQEPIPADVHIADREALAVERRFVMHPPTNVDWGVYGIPPKGRDRVVLIQMRPEDARDAFIQRYQSLVLRQKIEARDASKEHTQQ